MPSLQTRKVIKIEKQETQTLGISTRQETEEFELMPKVEFSSPISCRNLELEEPHSSTVSEGLEKIDFFDIGIEGGGRDVTKIGGFGSEELEEEKSKLIGLT
jgi:hypothetical protein